jgi:hypothetical protein
MEYSETLAAGVSSFNCILKQKYMVHTKAVTLLREDLMLGFWRGSQAIAVCLWLLLGSPANATSFDCAKAHTLQEKLICSDDGLGVLSIYKKVGK